MATALSPSIFPLELSLIGVPLSFQAKASSRERWKAVVRHAARVRAEEAVELVWLDDEPLAVTIYYFPTSPMGGDGDNIVNRFLMPWSGRRIWMTTCRASCGAEIRACRGLILRSTDRSVIRGAGYDRHCQRSRTVLEAQGEHRAAFVLGWSLLEAALHRIEHASSARPRTPGTVVQTLAMLGYIDPELEQRVRPLIPLRNRVVHGDLAVEPSSEDVLLILSAVEQALSDA